MLASEQCEDKEPADGETASLSPNSFWVLFTLTMGTSTIALLVYLIRVNYASHEERTIWRLKILIIQQWDHAKRRMSRRVSDVSAESPMNSPNSPHAMPTQV